MRNYASLKRFLDVAAGSALTILAAPVGLAVAGAVRCKLGSPVLFRQTRPGKDGKPFTLLKFRTMRSPLPGVVEDDADRLVPLGRLLRATSLDELPSLLNVVKGDMSFVGPRPLLPEYLPLYSPRQALRHGVRPGITGLAQVNGRNATTWPERLEWDARYVERMSAALDAHILWRTVAVVFARKGISQEGHATMPRFAGEA